MSFNRVIMLALLAGCATADRVQQLEEKVANLEKKVEEQAKAPARPATADGGAPVDPAKEEAAQKLYTEINGLLEKGDFATAKTKVAQLESEFGDTKTAKRASRISQELAVIGKPAPAELKVEKWFQGDAVNLSGGKATLVVFWEEWCPHCKREVPELVKTYDQYKGQGLQVVGLTKITRKATEEGVQAFIKDNNVTYPMAKETGEMSEYFNVSGIPAAAVIKDGQVVWRGHPGRITPEMLTSWLGS